MDAAAGVAEHLRHPQSTSIERDPILANSRSSVKSGLADVAKALGVMNLASIIHRASPCTWKDVGTHYVERTAEISCNHPEDRRGSVDRRLFTFDTRHRVEEEGETVHPVPDTTDLCHCGSHVDTVLLPGLHDYLVSRHGV